MINQIREQLFTVHYDYEDPLDRRRAYLLLLLTWVSVSALSLWVLLFFLLPLMAGGHIDPLVAAALAFVSLLEYAIYRLLQTGQLRMAVWLFILGTMLVTVPQVVVRNDVGPDLVPTPLVLLTMPLVAAGILSN